MARFRPRTTAWPIRRSSAASPTADALRLAASRRAEAPGGRITELRHRLDGDADRTAHSSGHPILASIASSAIPAASTALISRSDRCCS